MNEKRLKIPVGYWCLWNPETGEIRKAGKGRNYMHYYGHPQYGNYNLFVTEEKGKWPRVKRDRFDVATGEPIYGEVKQEEIPSVDRH